MSPAARRKFILETLCNARFITTENLAFDLSVSVKTIRRDIRALSCLYPIKTVRGRHGGGVKVEEWFQPSRNTLAKPQEILLLRLREQLSGEDLIIMNSILVQFSASKGC